MIFKEIFEPVVQEVAPGEVCWILYRTRRFLWWSRSEVVAGGVTGSEYRAWRKVYGSAECSVLYGQEGE